MTEHFILLLPVFLPVFLPVVFWAAYHLHADRHLLEPPCGSGACA